MLTIVINHSYTSTMKNLDAKEVLGNGITFTVWRMALRAKLGRKNVLGHVFHDIPGIRPVLIPIDPLLTNPDAENAEQHSNCSFLSGLPIQLTIILTVF